MNTINTRFSKHKMIKNGHKVAQYENYSLQTTFTINVMGDT